MPATEPTLIASGPVSRRRAVRWVGLLFGACCVLGGVWFMLGERTSAPLTRHAPIDAQMDVAEQPTTPAAPLTLVASGAALASALPSQSAPALLPLPPPSSSPAVTKADARAAPLFAAPAALRRRQLSLSTDRARGASLPLQTPAALQIPLVATALPASAAPVSPPVERK